MARHGHRESGQQFCVLPGSRIEDLGCGHGAATGILTSYDQDRAVRQESRCVTSARLIEVAFGSEGSWLAAPKR